MGVLAQNQWSHRIGGGVLLAHFVTAVHRTENIRIPVQNRTFVLHRPGRVIGLDPVVGLFKIDSVACFVTETPNDDTRMITVSEDHSGYPVEMGCFVCRVFGKRCLFVTHTVRFDIRLVDDVQTISVAEFIPARIVRIVTGPYSINVQPLHDLYIANHLLF